jgi:DNA repair protein RecO (recombination protein O)
MASRTVTAATSRYVLHRDWSESSLILDLFTREQGRLAVAAKGAKRPYSQLRAVLLPFQQVHIVLSRPRRSAEDEAPPEVQTLRGAEWAGGAAMLTGAALFAGFHCNELLMKLLARGDPHPLLFDAYAQTLPELAGADDAKGQAALRAFDSCCADRPVARFGLSPQRSALREDERFALRPDAGVAPAGAGDAGLPGAVLIGAQAALELGSMAALREVCAAALPGFKTTLRTLLAYHLGTPTLRTRQVMLDLQLL